MGIGGNPVQSIELHLSNGNVSTAFSELKKELSGPRSAHFANAVAESDPVISSCIYILTHLFIDPTLSFECIEIMTLLAAQNPQALIPFLRAGAFDALAQILRVLLNQSDPSARQFFDPVFNLISKTVPAVSPFNIIGVKASHWLFFLELLRKSKGDRREHVTQMLEQIRDCLVPASEAGFLETLVESLMIGNELTMESLAKILHDQVVRLCAHQDHESIPPSVTIACLVTLMTVDSVEIAIPLVMAVRELCKAPLHCAVVATCKEVDFDRILCNISNEKLERALVGLMRDVHNTVADENFMAKFSAIKRRVQKRIEWRKSSDESVGPPPIREDGPICQAFMEDHNEVGL